MEIPTVVIGSKTEIVQAEESIPEKPNEQAEASKPQEQNENIDESSRPEELNDGIKESSNLEELHEPGEDSKSPDQNVQPEEDKVQDPNKQAEDSKSQGNGDHIEEDRPEELSAVVGESSEITVLEEVAEKSKLLEMGRPAEESAVQDVKEQIEDSKPQDLKEQMEMPEQHPEEESALSSIPDSQYISTPESKTDDQSSALSEQTEDSKPQDLEEKTEEQMESSLHSIKRVSSVSSSTGSQKRYVKKKKKNEAINTEPKKYPYNRPVTTEIQSYGRVPLQGSLAQPLKPKMVDKAIQCNKLLMRRLPLPGTLPPQRNVISQVSPPGPRENKGTQISQSFERFHKRPPPLVLKKRDEDKSIARLSPSKSSPPIFCKGNGNLSKGIMRKSSGNIRRSGSLSKGSRSRSPKQTAVSSVSQAFSQTSKKGKSRSPNVVYNFYLNACDGLKGIDRAYLMGTCCKESTEWPGLSKACKIFSSFKSGRLHVSKLHHVLDMLGILVTSEEMYQTLCLVKTDESCMLDCTEFLEVVNQTSPFAETEALQNTLRAFRKVKKGMVSVDDLPSVLRDLEVHLCMNEIQTALENTRLNKNKKVDLLEFLLTARDLQKSLEEEDDVLLNECTAFRDVSGLVTADSRWRRNYHSCWDEDIGICPSFSPWLALTDSYDHICPAHVCWKSNLRGSHSSCTVCNAEGEDKENATVGEKKSSSDTNIKRSASLTSPVKTAEGEEEGLGIPKALTSQTDITENTDPRTLPSEPTAEGESKNHDSVEAPRPPSN